MELQEKSSVNNPDKDENKTENQLQIPKKSLGNNEIKEVWVVIERDDSSDKEFELC